MKLSELLKCLYIPITTQTNIITITSLISDEIRLLILGTIGNMIWMLRPMGSITYDGCGIATVQRWARYLGYDFP